MTEIVVFRHRNDGECKGNHPMIAGRMIAEGWWIRIIQPQIDWTGPWISCLQIPSCGIWGVLHEQNGTDDHGETTWVLDSVNEEPYLEWCKMTPPKGWWAILGPWCFLTIFDLWILEPLFGHEHTSDCWWYSMQLWPEIPVIRIYTYNPIKIVDV